MPTTNILFKKSYAINDSISVLVPSVGEILEDEDNYYSVVSGFTAMPIDMMAQLDDAGIDFASIDEYKLFLLMFRDVAKRDTSLVFSDLDLSKFQCAISEQNGNAVLVDKGNGIVIDRAIHDQIAGFLRKIHHIEKNRRKPANAEARDFMLQRAKDALKRQSRRKRTSQLESLVIAMVNSEPYKYKYEETKNLSIYQFNESVRQVIKKTDYNNRIHGVYAGTVNVKDLSQDDLNWLTHK